MFQSRILAAGAACAVMGLAGAAGAGGPVDFYLTVLHHSDGESQLLSANPTDALLSQYGGVARFKTLADQLKADALAYPAGPEEKGFVFVSAGDTFLPGPEFNASLDLPMGQPFFDSKALALIGYDALILGNHDFDFGPDILQRFIEDFLASGGTAPFVSANLDFSNEAGFSALLANMDLVRSTVVTVGTRQVGIVGATTTDLPFIATPRDVIVNALLPVVQDEVDALTMGGVDIVILISHLQGLSSEGALIAQLRDVDAVVGAGGGELLSDGARPLIPGDSATGAVPGVSGTGYPRTATDLDGKTVPVFATRGDYRYIGRAILGFDSAGNLVSFDDPADGPYRVSGNPADPDAVAADPMVQTMIVDPVADSVAGLAMEVIGQTEDPLDGQTSSVRNFETNLGSLCADAMLWNAVTRAAEFGAPVAQVALQNGGGMRNNVVVQPGDFTALDAFNILPFANFVSVAGNIPPAQFKEIMENCVSRIPPGSTSGNGRFAQIAGFRMVYDPNGTRIEFDSMGNTTVQGTRVQEIVLNDGTPIVLGGQVVPGAPSVNIATIDFLLRGGDQFPFRGAPFVNLGVSYQQSLTNYITEFLAGDISAQEYPEGGEGRILQRTSMTSLTEVLGNWGEAYPVYEGEDIGLGAGDFNGDGVVDFGDITEVLSRFNLSLVK